MKVINGCSDGDYQFYKDIQGVQAVHLYNKKGKDNIVDVMISFYFLGKPFLVIYHSRFRKDHLLELVLLLYLCII